MLFQIKAYLNFLLRSTNEHGVHSPFVFDLVTKCVYDRKYYPEYALLKKYRKSLLHNSKTINVEDFGAGSKVFSSNRRSIAKIAKTAGIAQNRARLLFRVTHYFKPEYILEIGTSLGLATSAMSAGNPKARITTLEGCKETALAAVNEFAVSGFSNITAEITEFDHYLSKLKKDMPKYGLVYFDGNHQCEATLRYFELLLPTATNESVWIFDDIHWSAEMSVAWETIKKHPAVTVAIDTFQWGIIFFRQEQQKESFVIRA
jgi:predicted O-methyltransferase YrrM